MTAQTKYRVAAALTGIAGAVLAINILQHYISIFHVFDVGTGLFFVSCIVLFVAGAAAYYYRSQVHLERTKSSDQIAVETLAQIAQARQKTKPPEAQPKDKSPQI